MDTMNYILFKNPVVTHSVKAVKYAANATGNAMGYKGVTTSLNSPSPTYTEEFLSALSKEKEFFSVLSVSRNYVKLAGLLGASAVVIGAYGAHTLMSKDGKEHEKKIFETASKYHFYHTCALLAVPFCKFPKVTALCFVSGIVLFSGSCYHQSLMDDQTFRKVTPYGGCLLILAWLTMML